uniref:DSN1 component of MIS12 kinetochore complex n=1 Tax=Falco tinnunculus TaxID=100819 RepID=A0A8C4UQI8_FALTI
MPRAQRLGGAAMAERGVSGSGPAGSTGPVPVPPQLSGGSQEERSPGGARPAAGGGAADSDPGEEQADPKQFLKQPDKTAGSKNSSPHGVTRAAVKTSRRSPSLGKSTFRLSPLRKSTKSDNMLSSFSLSPRLLITTPQARRRSWRRSSLKGTRRRTSLPPLHQDVTELSKSISLDLPEIDRLSVLLLSSFEFSAQKLEHVLKQTDGFSHETYRANVHSVSEDLKRYMQKLKRDGTLKSCIENPKGVLLDVALDESVAQIKEYIARFTAECQSWDRLLQRYQEGAGEISRQLEERQRQGGWAEPPPHLQTSQAQVLSSKPDYQKILDDQEEVFCCMELVLDELQQAVTVLQTFSEDSRLYLHRLSEQLAARTFRQVDKSPVRKLIAAPPRKALPPEG